MARILCLVALWATLAVLADSASAQSNPESDAPSAKKPNFVLLLVDDLGYGDVGAYGSDYHLTPNIDRLAASGVRFTQAYAASPVCSPSRAAILTGCSPARLHLTDWIGGRARRNTKLRVPDWKMHIDHERITVAEALREAGYATMFAGKWHLTPPGKNDRAEEHTPTHHGFDINVGGCAWGHPGGKGRYFAPFGMPNLEGEDGDFLTDRLTEESLRFIESKQHEPFFLFLSYYAVHEPLMTKQALLKKYKQRAKSAPKGGWTGRVTPAYAGMIQSVDESVGRVLDKLTELGLDEDTIVIFTSDNGGAKAASNGGLQGAKATAWEGGVREPLIIRWPGASAPHVNASLTIAMDFYPTMLEMAGLPAAPAQHADGVSLVPTLRGQATLTDRALYWHYPHYHKTPPYSAVRDGDWRLVELFESGELLLFDLKDDPAESTDLAASRPEKVKELHDKLVAWRKSVDAQLPTPNPDYDPNASAKRRKKKNSNNE